MPNVNVFDAKGPIINKKIQGVHSHHKM